jgi:dCMP deaminase
MEMLKTRPTWDEYFVAITRQVATRSTCLRRKVGAIIVKDKRILTTGYNGAPKGVKNSLEIGTCLREELGVPSGERQEICRGLHAEQNAILQAAYHGVSIKGAVMYCTTQPCITCSKMIINAGIVKIYYLEDYPDPLAIQILDEAGVEYVKLDL